MRAPCRAIVVALFATTLVAPSAAAGDVEDGSRPYGVVIQTPTTDPEFVAMRDGGVGTYRWSITWPAVQPEPGADPDWSGTDRVVADLAENGIEPLPVLYGTPCYVVECREAEQVSAKPPIDSAEGRRGWARFVGEVVRRYGRNGSFWSERPSIPYRPIRVWQVWNEQNVPQFYRPAPSVNGYAELLAISSRAIRSVDAQATVLLGGMPGDPGQRGSIDGAPFLDELYGIGAGGDFDAVAVHPYSQDLAGVRSQVAAMHQMLEAHAQTKTPIWVTELGWGVDSGSGRGLFKTLDGQAEALRRSFGFLESRRDAWNLERVLWYAWRDSAPGQAACDWCRTAGLIDAEGNPRPAWTAFAALSGGTPVSPADLEAGEDGSVRWILVVVALALVATAAAWLVRRRSAPPNRASR
jgi:polysaccharide biosynthesis protein PslG